MNAGRMIRDARTRHGLSQAQLAFRAGTRQSAISRLEQGEVSPSVETLELLLNAVGETLWMETVPMERRYDPLHRKAMADRSPEDRLALAVSWNRTAGKFREAGKRARGAAGRGTGQELTRAESKNG